MVNLFGWLFVIAIVIGVVAYSNPHLVDDVKDKVMEILGTGKTDTTPTKPKFNDCEEKAKELIPETITLKEMGTEWWLVEVGRLASKWTDGSEIFYDNILFKRGSGTGENINYYYPSGFNPFGSKGYEISYSKKIISNDGIVLGTNEFKITPILKPIEDTLRSEGRFTLKDFEFIELNFISCNWVE